MIPMMPMPVIPGRLPISSFNQPAFDGAIEFRRPGVFQVQGNCIGQIFFIQIGGKGRLIRERQLVLLGDFEVVLKPLDLIEQFSACQGWCLEPVVEEIIHQQHKQYTANGGPGDVGDQIFKPQLRVCDKGDENNDSDQVHTEMNLSSYATPKHSTK